MIPNARSTFFLRLLLILCGCFFGSVRADEQLDPQAVEFFETRIRPVLIKHCYECHSAEADPVMGGLRVDTKAGLVTGGETGPAFEAGSPEQSLLIRALEHEELEMPPEGKLPAETIRSFVEWIRMGAPDPRTEEMPKRPASDASDTPHWAFEPVQKLDPPHVKTREWPLTDIDRFVLAAMEAAGVEPVGEATKTALIRRVYFDLWGLPPDSEAVEAFKNDGSPQALANLIDRLLASPRFGERWGRHWLDIARYGESTGHERNFLYPHAWRYRDYVISSFNQDKPYDQFLIEQIAGDLLPAISPQQRDEQNVATGFLSLGPRNLLGATQQFALDTADDQINVTTRAVLGLTVSCARCHDHKFDPISTREYYSLAGIFLSTDSLYGTLPGTGGGNNRFPSELVPLGEDAEQRNEAVREHAKLIARATEELGKAQNQLKKLTSLPAKKQEETRDERVVAKDQVDKAQQQLDELQRNAPEPPKYAMGVRDAKKIMDTQIRISGDPAKTGELAPRGVLSCCSPVLTSPMPEGASGRLELAQWLVAGDNPLTSRVAVNRIWMHLLGRGIVPTADNFGRNGRLPTHPQLLDWLAAQFQEDGWSLKRTIRRIMLSRVYQLDSQHHAGNYEVDPGNELFWRWSPRRLEAEAIRDSMLAVSGFLELVPPPTGSIVAELGDGCLVRQIDADKLKVDAGYRSVYLPNARYFEPEMLQVFDGAAASLVVGERAETNVPAQALFFLNNEFSIAQAKIAAERILELRLPSPSQRIELIYGWALGRQPTTDELGNALRYLQRAASQLDPNSQAELSIWAGLVQAVFASAEFRYLY